MIKIRNLTQLKIQFEKKYTKYGENTENSKRKVVCFHCPTMRAIAAYPN
jgi:hypothetical protein